MHKYVLSHNLNQNKVRMYVMHIQCDSQIFIEILSSEYSEAKYVYFNLELVIAPLI